MSSSVIHQPHDKFIKLSLGEPQVAQEFFTEHLPTSLLQVMDLTTLQLQKHTFIDEHFKNSEADVIYSVQAANTIAYLFLLCEHQSTIDPWIAFRLWVYRIRLMEVHCKQHPGQPLPLVYPLVIYTGQAPWNAPLNIIELFGTQQALAEEWFFKPFQLLDIHQLNDEDIRRRQWCGIVEFSLKYKQIRDFSQFLKTAIPWIQEIEEQGAPGFSLAKIVIKYMVDGIEAQDAELFVQGIQEYLSPELRREAMTLAQQFKQQGEVTVISQMLRHRFKQVPETYLKQIEQADDQTLLRLVGKIMDAKTLEDIFEKL